MSSTIVLESMLANHKLNPTLEEKENQYVSNENEKESKRPPGQLDVWASIQSNKKKDEPYVHPLVKRSSSLLSQESLEICTESLGSESGSDDYFSSDDDENNHVPVEQEKNSEENEEDDVYFELETKTKKELVMVNYHCSISRRSSLPRSFPPPLPSISRRDGPCLQMRPHRRDGRLVVEAVTVPSQNYLHAERHNGRLLLSFINTTSSVNKIKQQSEMETAMMMMKIEQQSEMEAETDPMMEEADEDQEEAEEEEVEVVDRGTVVEVTVSTQPQQNGATKKVHRSSIVINKFVSCTSANGGGHELKEIKSTRPSISPSRRLSTATTTAAAAAVEASSLSALSAADGSHSSTNDNKLLFTSRRRSREELLHDMRRCSQLRKPLFIWEPCCIATSS